MSSPLKQRILSQGPLVDLLPKNRALDSAGVSVTLVLRLECDLGDAGRERLAVGVPFCVCSQ